MQIFQRMKVSYLQDFTMVNAENEELMMTMLVNGVCLWATIQAFSNFSKYKYVENAIYEGTIEVLVLLGKIWNPTYKVRTSIGMHM